MLKPTDVLCPEVYRLIAGWEIGDLRDDGVVFALSHDTPGVEAVRSIVLGSTLKSLDARFGYATLGLTRQKKNVCTTRRDAPKCAIMVAKILSVGEI